MQKLIEIKPKPVQKGFAEFKNNLSNKNNDENYKRILNVYNNIKNLNDNDKEIINKILNSYKKNEKFIQGDFILSKHEINEFNEQENKNILRYLIYRYKYNIFPIIKKVEDYPPNIQIEITSICNLRCIMCYQSDKTFSNKSKGFMGHMKFDLFKKIIDEIEGKIEGVTFASRGEPTLYKNLDKCLQYCEGKFLGLKLNTNATMLNEKLIHNLLSSDLQTLVLSIDEKDKENYEKIRVNAKFHKIMKNLEKLANIKQKSYKKSKIKIRISGVKINNSQNIEEMNNFYRKFADEVALVNYNPWQSAYDNPINDVKDPCSDLFRRLFVWWDGKVNPCDYDYKSTLSKWNAKSLSIKEIWNSEYYNNLRNLHLNQKRNQINPCNRCIAI